MTSWKETTFSNLGQCIRGVSYKPHNLREASGIKTVTLLRSNNIRGGRLNFRDVQYVEAHTVRPEQHLKPSDIAVCMSNGNRALVGKAGYFDEASTETAYTVGAFCSVFRPSEDYDSGFVRYQFSSPHYQKQLDSLLAGSAINNLKGSDVEALKALVPTCRREQSKIAEVLSTVDEAIEQTEVLIAKQQRIKTGMMQDLLTRGIDERGNLRSEQTHEFKDSPLGRIPVEWSAVKLDQLASRVGSGVTPTGGESVYTSEGVLFIRSQNVHFDGLRLNDVAYIPERIHLSMLRSETFENDVLLNITGASIGRCCRMPNIDGYANVNQHVCTIRLLCSTEATAGVLAAVLESYIGQSQIAQLNAGGNREGLNYQQVRSFVLPWPGDDSEFVRIIAGIRQMADSLNASKASLGKLRHLKTGLMQDLLTGNRRVTELLEQREDVTT